MMDWIMCHNCTGKMYPDGDGWKCSACGIRRDASGRHYFPEKTHTPMTNGDRIRAMTDEELIDTFSLEDKCPPDYCGSAFCNESDTCRDCWIRWLQKPTTEVGGDG